jgi:hypothetical protein
MGLHINYEETFLGLPGPLFASVPGPLHGQRCFIAAASLCRPSGVMPRGAFAELLTGRLQKRVWATHLAFCAADRLSFAVGAEGHIRRSLDDHMGWLAGRR